MNEVRFSLAGRRVWIAGHRGMVGSALVRRLAMEGAEILAISRSGLDLRRQKDVEGWIAANKPEVVVLAATAETGMAARAERPAEFLYDNLAIQQNAIDGSWRAGVERLLYLCASRAPDDASSPADAARRDAGDLVRTAGVNLVQAYRAQHGVRYIAAQPACLYGPGARLDENDSHIAAAAMARILRAKLAGAVDVTLPFSRGAYRDLLHVGDLAEACACLLQRHDGPEPVTIAGGDPISVVRLAATIARIVEYRGRVGFARPRRDKRRHAPLDGALVQGLGWRPAMDLETGLRDAYLWLQGNRPELFVRDDAA